LLALDGLTDRQRWEVFFFALASGAKGTTLPGMEDNQPNGDAGPLRASRSSVLKHLIAVAEGEDTKPKERIAALAEIARIKGMVTKKVETSMTIKGSVMLVPFCSSPEEWSALTVAHDKRLRDEVKSAPLPSPES
jgi:hypothetical protein